MEGLLDLGAALAPEGLGGGGGQLVGKRNGLGGVAPAPPAPEQQEEGLVVDATQLALQTIFNMFVVTGLAPVTGAALPFFSYGGTSLLMLLGEAGVVLGVSRKIPAPEQG